MAHGRVKPAGWGVNDKLTSAQINQLDINVSESLDKTAAGDTIAGQVGFSGGGNIAANVAASVRSTVAGGIQHAGGASDWATFSAARSRGLISSPSKAFKSTNFTANSVGHLQSSAIAGQWKLHLDTVHDGATIASVILYFKIQTGHGAMPATLPKLSVIRVDLTTGAVGVTLSSADVGTGLAISSAVAVGPYENGGAIQSFTYTVDQNALVDRSKYDYIVALDDEAGANAIAGNAYVGVLVNNGAINSMKFP